MKTTGFKERMRNFFKKTLLSRLFKLDSSLFYVMLYDLLALLSLLLAVIASNRAIYYLLTSKMDIIQSVLSKVSMASAQNYNINIFTPQELLFAQKSRTMYVMFISIIALTFIAIIAVLTLFERIAYSRISGIDLDLKFYLKKLLFNVTYFFAALVISLLILKLAGIVIKGKLLLYALLIMVILLLMLFFIATSVIAKQRKFLSSAATSIMLFAKKIHLYIAAYAFLFLIFAIIVNLVVLSSVLGNIVAAILLAILLLFWFFIVRKYIFILTEYFLDKDIKAKKQIK